MLCSGDDPDMGRNSDADALIAGYVSRRAIYYFKSSGWSRCWCVLRGRMLQFFADRGAQAALDELPIDENTNLADSPRKADEVEDDPAPSPHQLLVQTAGMGWLICVESAEAKEAWWQQLCVARRPHWVSDSSEQACGKCNARFSFTRRRCEGLASWMH